MMMIARIVRCLLGIYSPSRAMLIAYGQASEPVTWLDRWERRIDDAVAEKMLDERNGEWGPYVCPGCHAVASRCAVGCPDKAREDSAALAEHDACDWDNEEEYQ